MSDETGETPRTDAVAGADPMCDGHWDHVQIVALAALARQLERELAAETQRREAAQELVDAVTYAMKSGCFFPVSEPKPGAGTEAWVRWGAMRNLHDKFAALSQQKDK